MTDPNAPPSSDDDTSDELFDRDFLEDSDSEFLAELDRVLSPDKPASAQPSEDDEKISLEPMEDASDFDLDLDLDNFTASEESSEKNPNDPQHNELLGASFDIDDLAPPPEPPSMTDASETQTTDEPDWSRLGSSSQADDVPETFDELLQAQASPAFSSDATTTLTNSLDQGDEKEDSLFAPITDDGEEEPFIPLDELSDDVLEPFTPLPTSTSETREDTPQPDFALALDEELAQESEIPSDVLNGGLLDPLSSAEPILPEPSLSEDVDPVPEPAEHAPSETSNEATAEAALAAEAAASAAALTADQTEAASTVKPTDPIAPAAAPTPKSSSAWNGLVALLALMGIGGAGMALWQNWQTAGQTNPFSQPSASNAAVTVPLEQATDPSPVIIKRLDDSERRVEGIEQRMDQEMLRVDGELSSLYEAVTARPARQLAVKTSSEADPKLDKLNADISLLKQQLNSLRTQLSSTQQTLRDNQSRLEGLSKAPAQASAVAQPLPTVTRSAKTEPPTRKLAASTTKAKPATPVQDKPTTSGKGRYVVNLMSFRRATKAQGEQQRLMAEGIPVELITVTSRGKTWHRLSVRGFKSFDAAKEYVESVRSHPGLGTAWIGRS